MTQPQTQAADGMLAQILVKQGEIGAQLAAITEQLKDIPDHEQRIRVLELARAKVWGGTAVLGALCGGGAAWIALAVTHR